MKQKIKIPGYDGEWVEAHCTETLTAEDEVLHFVRVKENPMPRLFPGYLIVSGSLQAFVLSEELKDIFLVAYGLGIRKTVAVKNIEAVYREGKLIWERPFL